MRVGILVAGHPPEALKPQIGSYARLFETLLAGHGLTFCTWEVVEGHLPNAAQDADAWIITGSRHSAYDPLPWIAPLEALIRTARDTDQPLIGAFFGHQIVAQALGGTVTKAPGGWIAGHQTYHWGARDIALHAWHQDQVIALPPGAKPLAHSDNCPYAALAYGARMLTVQAHPEYDRSVLEGLLTHRGDVMPATTRDAARTSLGPPTDAAWVAQRFIETLTG